MGIGLVCESHSPPDAPRPGQCSSKQSATPSVQPGSGGFEVEALKRAPVPGECGMDHEVPSAPPSSLLAVPPHPGLGCAGLQNPLPNGLSPRGNALPRPAPALAFMSDRGKGAPTAGVPKAPRGSTPQSGEGPRLAPAPPVLALPGGKNLPTSARRGRAWAPGSQGGKGLEGSL